MVTLNPVYGVALDMMQWQTEVYAEDPEYFCWKTRVADTCCGTRAC